MNIIDYLPKDTRAIFYTDDTWISERNKGIGGSDVGTLLGMNPYKSKLKLYKEKAEGYYEDLSENVNIKKGKELEDLIRIKYVVPYFMGIGYRVIHPDVMLINPKCPHLRVNLDALAVPEIPSTPEDNIVVEIKWVSEYGEANWNGEAYFGIPAYYYAQVQAYMYTTGAKKAVLFALFDSTWTVKRYEVPFNPDFANKMATQIACFMNVNVGMKIAPKLDSTSDKAFITDYISEDTPIVNSEEMTELISEYNDVKSRIKNLEKNAKIILDNLVNKYVAGERPSSPLCKMKITKYQTSKFDTASFKESEPDLYAQYVKKVDCTKITVT